MAYLGKGAKTTLANASSPSTGNVALPTNVAGDFLVMVWWSEYADSTLTGPSGWSGPVGIARTSQFQSDLSLYYKVSGGSEPSTVSISNDGQASTLNGGEAIIYNFGPCTFEASGTWDGTSASTTISLASLTSGGTSRLRVDCYANQGGSPLAGPFTHTAGSAEREDDKWGLSDIAITAAGADSGRTATATTGTAWLQSVSLLLVDSSGPAAPTITGPSGAAGAGTSTANIAENATTGPTFSTDISLGGGYPTLTGAQAANWSITALTATSWRADPVAPFDFEASPTNPQTVVFNASASVAQTCTITIVNMPEFSGTVPAQSGITGTSFSLDLSPYFGTGSFTYAIASGSLTGSGLSLNASSGVISGTLGTVAVYTVTVSAAGAIGSAVNTNSFAITVSSTGTAPTVSTHPANTTVTAGATASFTAAAGGSPTPTVQWQENTGSWSNISGQTTTTLSLGVVGTPDNGRQFRAVFTNSSGSATTNTATLTVNAAAGDGTITSEPLKNNMGQLIGAATLSWVGFRNASTGADVLLLTSVAVNSSSIFTTGTNAALAPGQLYAINWKTSDGKYGYAWANAV